MDAVPAEPKVYHITHFRNLPGIISEGRLWSDHKLIDMGLDCSVVGLSKIKQRRLGLEVDCNPGTSVGDYVPFYFCPRSVMLYILHRGNHPDLEYSEGQRPILHLRADLRKVVEWADDRDFRWAFSDRNAGAYLAKFRNSWSDLDVINWGAVLGSDFRDPENKEGKQAEFLFFEFFPWELVEKIGVFDINVAKRVSSALEDAEHRPLVNVERSWYY